MIMIYIAMYGEGLPRFLNAIPAVPASIVFKRSTVKRRALSMLEKREISRGSTMFFTSATDLPTVLEYFRHCRVFAKSISCNSGPSAYQSQTADSP